MEDYSIQYCFLTEDKIDIIMSQAHYGVFFLQDFLKMESDARQSANLGLLAPSPSDQYSS